MVHLFVLFFFFFLFPLKNKKPVFQKKRKESEIDPAALLGLMMAVGEVSCLLILPVVIVTNIVMEPFMVRGRAFYILIPC
jgi:cytochrome c biogenesis protein CcdA